MKLFIDDERYPVDDGQVWVIARTLDAVKEVVNQHGIPSFISFDHDLGEDEPTGYEIAKWLVDQDLDGTHMFPGDFSFYVHSQNPIGKKNIEGYLDAFLAQKNS